MQERSRKSEGCRVAADGRSLDLRAAGIPEAEQAGDLVEGLAGRVVRRATEQLVLERALATVKAGMPAGDDQAGAREHVAIGISELARVKMPFEMVDGDEWDLECQRQGLRRR